MKKRLLAGLMAMCLVLTMLPASALAVEGSEEQKDTFVAKVDGRYYDSLADAVKAIDTEGTVELVADTTVNVVVNIDAGKTVILDLGSYKLTPSESCSSGKVLRNYGTLTIMADEGGTIDVSTKTPEWVAIENTKSSSSDTGGELNILSGTIIGNSCAVNMVNGTANISGGDLSNTAKSNTSGNPYSVIKVTSNAGVTISGNANLTGVEAAVTVYGGKLTIEENAYLKGTYGGVLLCNSDQSNSESAVHASLEMTGGTVVSDQGFSLAGNNLQSAGCSATITGGSLQQTGGETCIYWPMEGTLTIGGDAVVEGGSGIEVRMGTVTIQDSATIRGTGTYRADTPVSGQSQADGSAILISTEMYGDGENQFDESPDITVNIAGGTLESSSGNAVTVYNLETTKEQEAKVNITDGELQAASGKAAVQINTNKKEECTTALTRPGTGETTLQTSKSQTTVTVSESAAPALVGQGNTASYYANANDALNNVKASAENPATVYLLDDAEVTVTEGITLVTPEDVSLTVRPEEGKVIEKVENQDGTISYNVVDTSSVPLNPPTVSLSADKTSAYVGDSITLTASATSAEDATITYSWYKDGQKISGATTSTLTVTSSGTYTVVATAQKIDGDKTYSAEGKASISCTFVAREDDDNSSSSSSTSVRRYNIEADAGRGGDISPDGRVRVRRGEDQTFRITADDGWEIADVEVDGESVGAVERYTFENVRTDHTISVTFRQIVTEPEEPEAPALPFTDVSEGDWYHDAVAYCWENGIMDGTSGTVFAPNLLLNRAMMAQVLYNLADGTASTAAGFPDVAASAWYADAVNWAAANGYVTGYDNGLFGPEDDLTREQLAAILYRYAGSPAPAGSLDGFADAASASAYAVDALRWAVGEGLLTGKDGGRLDPTGTASRAELAQILARFAG